MKVNCIPAFQDNYFWIIENGKETAVVDPGESQSIIDWCELNQKVIDKILITHHHRDHCGGVKDLKRIFKSSVYASADDIGLIDDVDIWLKDSEMIDIGGELAKVKKLPGHTLGHIAFWFENMNKIFVGDTLFSMGCGRLFGGTPEQMWGSLKWIKQLPVDTQIYCAHEYTLGNLKFVKHLFTLISQNSFHEKTIKLIQEREKTLRELRKENIPTVPFFLFEELTTNPFLWCDEPEFIDSFSKEKKDPSLIFSRLREMKNDFH